MGYCAIAVLACAGHGSPLLCPLHNVNICTYDEYKHVTMSSLTLYRLIWLVGKLFIQGKPLASGYYSRHPDPLIGALTN